MIRETKMLKLLKRLWVWATKPSPHSIWDSAFKHLQTERRLNGRSEEYWRIWYEEVCPAYRRLSESTPKLLRHSLTDKVLEDMDKPIPQRKHF